MDTVSNETGKIKGFTRCCDSPEIIKQDMVEEPFWYCSECGRWHNTPKETKKIVKKITEGQVIQTYDEEGNCTGQEFTAGDQVDFEDDNGEPADVPYYEKYQPFDMVQPKTREEILKEKTIVCRHCQASKFISWKFCSECGAKH